MAADILLTVGISLESLRQARQRIETELKTWKVAPPLSLSDTDKRALGDSEKLTRALRTEFGKLGTAVGKGKLSEYFDIDQSAAKKATESFQEINTETNKANEHMARLAQSTAFYESKNKIMGKSLSSVSSELNGYLKVESQGIKLDAESQKRKTALIQEYGRLTNAQKGLLHGFDIKRILIWAVGWTTIYSALRLVTTAIASTVKNWIDFEQAMARAATVTRQVGMDQKSVMSAMTFTALEYSRKTTVAVTDVAKVLYHLGSAGLDASQQMQGFEHVLALTVGTLGDVDQISKLVASSYILFGDSIKHVTTISEKFQYITDILGKTYAEHQVELSEIASAFTYVGGAAALLDITFEELVGTIGFLNDGMLKGSKAGTSLMAAFVSLGSQAENLRKYFGVVWDTSKPINYLGILEQMRSSIGDTVRSTIVFSQLMQLFGRRGARAIVQIIQRWDDFRDAIEMSVTDVEGAAKKMQQIMESTVGGELTQLKNQLQAIATTMLQTFSPQIVKMLQDVNKSLGDIDLFELARRYGIAVINITSAIVAFARTAALAILTVMKPVVDTLAKIQRSATILKFIIPVITPGTFIPAAPIEAQESYDDLSKSIDKTLQRLKETPDMATAAADAIAALSSALTDAARAAEVLKKGERIIYPGQKETEEAIAKRMENLRKQRADEEALQKKIKITNAELERKYVLNLLEASGIGDVTTKQLKFADAISRVVDEIKQNKQNAEEHFNLLDEGKIKIDVMTMSFDKLVHEYKEVFDVELLKKFKEEWYDVTTAITEEVNKLSSELQGVTRDFVRNLFAGKGDISGFLSGIMDAYKDALADKLVEMFADETGIFAQMATGFMSPLQKAHYTGIKNAVPMIIKAHIEGIKRGMSQGSSETGKTGSALNLLDKVSNFFGGGKNAEGAETAAASQSIMQTLKEMAGQVLTVASFANEMANAYQYKGSGNPWGAATSLGTSGAIAGAAVGGPIGAVIGGTVGAIYGFIRGTQSKTTSEIQQQTLEITSAIKISNKELQIVNRNLEGIRKGFEGYILTRSTYFSERPGTEERFNLDRQRGILVL